MGSRLRRALRLVGIFRRDDLSSFELTLGPARDDTRRHAIESAKPIDRHTILETLGTSGLAASLLPVPLGNVLSGVGRDEKNPEDKVGETRVRFVRLTSGQALSMFEVILRDYPGVRKLYASLEKKGFELVEREVRGAVVRAYSADGVARREGIVIELSHESADGTEASFNVSIKDGVAGEADGSGGVKADYGIRRGGQLDIYEIEDGRSLLTRAAGTPGRASAERAE